jgi:ABC-type transporter Mla subunit MlaD
MRKIINQIFGITLIVAAIIGILFNITGVVLTWKYKNQVTTSAVTTVNLLTSTLDSTVQGLEVATSALQISINSVSALQNSVNTAAATIESAKPVLESLSGLVDGVLPTTVATAQKAIDGAQEGARVIDSVLKVVAGLPFVSKDIYNPETPLHEGLGKLSASLDELPTTFETMGSSLDSSTSNVETIHKDMTTIADNIGAISASLEEAQTVLTQYKTTASVLSARLKVLEERLPLIINVMAGLLTFIFVWLTLAMVGLLFQGLEMLGYRLLQEGEN